MMYDDAVKNCKGPTAYRQSKPLNEPLAVLYYICPHIVWCEKLEGLEDWINQLPFNSKNVLLKQKPNILSTRVHI